MLRNDQRFRCYYINGDVYLIYYDQSWYVTKNKSFRESDFLTVDSIKNAVSNTDQWLKIE